MNSRLETPCTVPGFLHDALVIDIRRERIKRYGTYIYFEGRSLFGTVHATGESESNPRKRRLRATRPAPLGQSRPGPTAVERGRASIGRGMHKGKKYFLSNVFKLLQFVPSSVPLQEGDSESRQVLDQEGSIITFRVIMLNNQAQSRFLIKVGTPSSE